MKKRCHYFSDDREGKGRLRGSNVKLAKTVFVFCYFLRLKQEHANIMSMPLNLNLAT